MDKYAVDPNEDEILPNLLDIQGKKEIDKAEFEGLLYAELKLANTLSKETNFTINYIKRIHCLAFKDIYAFAGKYRTVNVSKNGFLFPSAQFLPKSMADFDVEILKKLQDQCTDRDLLIEDIATVHAELLFIHPFREGNGRTARILANLMARKQGFKSLNFEKIDENIFPDYVSAVQVAAKKDYKPMVKIIAFLFEDDPLP